LNPIPAPLPTSGLPTQPLCFIQSFCPSFRSPDGLLRCWPHCHSAHGSLSRMQAVEAVGVKESEAERLGLQVLRAPGLLPEPCMMAQAKLETANRF
jgi:hypothetical protein